MDYIFQALLSWQLLLFCLAIAAVVFVIRRGIEYYLMSGHQKETMLWNELILPIMPVFLGAGAAIIATKYPYPDGIYTLSGRLVFGLVAGLLSTLAYRVLKAFLYSKVNLPMNNSSFPAPIATPPIQTLIHSPTNTEDTLLTNLRNSINNP